MNNFLIILITILSAFSLKAQDYRLVQKIEVEAISIEVDKFDYIYIIETYKISKYTTEGKLLFTYENIENGEISKFDVSDPLKPLVYYKDFNILNILDNKLAELNTINLFDKNINQIELICSSNNMEFWIYDNIDNRLKKLDKQFNFVNQSESFFNLFDKFSMPKDLKIRNNKLYALDKNGISIFDLYGTFIKTINVNNLESFQIFDENLVFLQKNELFNFDEKTLHTKKISIPKIDAKEFQIKLVENKLIIRTNSHTYIYSIN